MADTWRQNEAKRRLILGLVLSSICDPVDALELYRSALHYDRTLVAAHIQLGITYAYAEDYERMIDAFREAISLNPRAARAAACGEIAEVAQILKILFPPKSDHIETYVSAMPDEFRKAGDLVRAAMAHLASGCDAKAVKALERSLSIDPTSPLAIALLSLTYLLLCECGVAKTTGEDKSVLWDIDPVLAGLLWAHNINTLTLD